MSKSVRFFGLGFGGFCLFVLGEIHLFSFCFFFSLFFFWCPCGDEWVDVSMYWNVLLARERLK
jgi:hypothetical protein